MSNEGNMYLLPCMHRIHLECAKQTISLVCQVCRAPVNNYPKEIVAAISDNAKRYDVDTSNDDYRRLQTHYNNIMNNLTPEQQRLIDNPPPQVESMATLGALHEMGIPLAYLPTLVSIEIPTSSQHFQYPSGTFAYSIVHSVVNKILKDVGDMGVSDGEEEDNPFIEEDQILSMVHRGVRIRLV
jgi:hypothetical protein